MSPCRAHMGYSPTANVITFTNDCVPPRRGHRATLLKMTRTVVCGWCFGTGQTSAIGKGGRHTDIRVVCPDCGGLGIEQR